MPKPQRAPLSERINNDPNGIHHTADPDAHTGQVIRHPGQTREVSGTVVPPAPRIMSDRDIDRRHAEDLAASGMLPDTYRGRPENVVWAINYARDLNLPVSTVLASVYLSQDGKAAVTTALMSALVRNAGHTLRIKIHMPTGLPDTNTYASAMILRADDPDFIFESSPWTLERAQRAGLVKIVEGKPYSRSRNGKPLPWEKYPEAMLKARATSEVIRDAAQDCLLGMAAYTPEELGANVDEEGRPLDPGGNGQGFATEEPDTGLIGADMDLSGFDGPDLDQTRPEAEGESPAPEGQATGGFDPASASPKSWSAVAQQAIASGDVQALRELYQLFRAHRADDEDIQTLMAWVTDQAQQMVAQKAS